MTNAFSFKKLTKSPTSIKLGGFDDEVLICPVEAIKTMPSLPDEIKSEEDKVVATGSFVFNEGYTGFRSIMAQSNSVGLTPEIVGPTDSKSYSQKGKFSLAGDGIENDALMSDFNNYKFIVAIKKGKYHTLIGSLERPAEISAKPNYGQKAEDGVVHECEISCYNNTPALKYAGTVPTATPVVVP
jgi:hypothetical protein